MQLLFELLGENLEMAKEEVRGVLEVLNIPFTEVREDHLLFVISVEALGSEQAAFMQTRLGLTRTAGVVLAGPCPGPAELVDGLGDMDPALGGARSFAVRPKRLSSGDESLSGGLLASQIGAIVQERAGLRVDLTEPEAVLDVFISEQVYLTRRVLEVERTPLEDRKVQFRKHFSPVSLHPKYARACINLARCRDNFLDPFCGTGGFLIEGGLMGVSVFGSDIDPAMVEGAQANLEQFNVKDPVLMTLDVGNCSEWKTHPKFPEDGFEAVVADPPYGRSSSTAGEEVKDIYSRAFTTLSEIMAPGGRLLLVSPDKDFKDLAKDPFLLQNVFEQFVHGTLTRYYMLFIKARS